MKSGPEEPRGTYLNTRATRKSYVHACSSDHVFLIPRIESSEARLTDGLAVHAGDAQSKHIVLRFEARAEVMLARKEGAHEGGPLEPRQDGERHLSVTAERNLDQAQPGPKPEPSEALLLNVGLEPRLPRPDARPEERTRLELDAACDPLSFGVEANERSTQEKALLIERSSRRRIELVHGRLTKWNEVDLNET